MTAPSPDVFVKAALSTIGLENRTAGFWFHKIQAWKLPKIIHHQNVN